MESFEQFSQECLKSCVDFESVTIADLRKKYMKREGLKQMSKNDKVLFSSTVKRVLSELLSPKVKICNDFEGKDAVDIEVDGHSHRSNTMVYNDAENCTNSHLLANQNENKFSNYLKEKNVVPIKRKNNTILKMKKNKKLKAEEDSDDEPLPSYAKKQQKHAIMSDEIRNKENSLESPRENTDESGTEQEEDSSILEKENFKELEIPDASDDEEVATRCEKMENNSCLEQALKAKLTDDEHSLGTSSDETEEEIIGNNIRKMIPKKRQLKIDSSDSDEDTLDFSHRNGEKSSLDDILESDEDHVINRKRNNNCHSKKKEKMISRKKKEGSKGNQDLMSEKNEVSTSVSSDDSALSNDGKPLKKIQSKQNKVISSDDEINRKQKCKSSVSESENECLASLKNRVAGKGASSDENHQVDTSDSIDYSAVSKDKLSKKVKHKQKAFISSDEEINRKRQCNFPVTNSEDESLASLKNDAARKRTCSDENGKKKSGKKLASNVKWPGSDLDKGDEITSEESESEPKSAPKRQRNRRTKESKVREPSFKVSNRIENLKKYVRTAGIHVQSYAKLFESCKSGKAQVEKMLGLLQKEGLKGHPTLEKCKKLRKRIERRKEIAELDVKNIIATEGRPKRGVHNQKMESGMMLNHGQEENRFSRILDVIGSEESD